MVLELSGKHTTMEPYYIIKKIRIKHKHLYGFFFFQYAICSGQHVFIQGNALNTVNKGDTINSNGTNNRNLIRYSYNCMYIYHTFFQYFSSFWCLKLVKWCAKHVAVNSTTILHWFSSQFYVENILSYAIAWHRVNKTKLHY